jgi:EmrB/QacA subfamily drug resistance transporter
MSTHAASDGTQLSDVREVHEPAAPPEQAAPAIGSPPGAEQPTGRPGGSTGGSGGWLVPLIVIMVGMFMAVLDISIVNVAVPAIRAEFGASMDSIQWINTGYSLTVGVVVPAAAWLGMRFGLRRVYLWSLVLFALASAMCGFAGGLEPLIMARIVQGIPGGMLPVVCITIVMRLVPPEKLGAAMGIYGLGVTAAPGAGPMLGGYLVEYVDWRLVFFLNVPIGTLGLIAAVLALPKLPADGADRFDYLGFGAIAGSLFSLLLALEEGPKWGWTSYPTLILLALGVNLMALFVIVELQVGHPLLDLRVFTSWQFDLSMVLITTTSIAFFSTLFYIPSFLQGAQGLTAFHAGLVMAPLAAMLMITNPIIGRLYDRLGPRWLAMAGLLTTATGLLILSQINVDISRAEIILGTSVMCAGLGIGWMPIMTGALASVPTTLAPHASGLNQLIMQVSQGLGLAGLAAMVTAQRAQLMADRAALIAPDGANADPRILAMQEQGPAGLLGLWGQVTNQVQAQTYSNAFLAVAVLVAGGALLTFFLPSRPPANTGDATPAAMH